MKKPVITIIIGILCIACGLIFRPPILEVVLIVGGICATAGGIVWALSILGVCDESDAITGMYPWN